MEGHYSIMQLLDDEEEKKKYEKRKLIVFWIGIHEKIEYLVILLSYIILTFFVNDLTTNVYTYFHGADVASIIGKVYGVLLSIPFTLLLYGIQKKHKVCFFLAICSIPIIFYIWGSLFHIPSKNSNNIQKQLEISSNPFPKHDIQTMVMSLPLKNGNCRRSYIERTLNINQIPFQFVDALDVSNADPNQVVLSQFYGMSKNAVMIQSMVKSMQEGSKIAANSTSWVLVLEDDASLSPSFSKKIKEIINNEKEQMHDIVWLDVRTYPAYAAARYITCCTAGMLFRRASIPRIVEYLQTRNQVMVEFVNKRNGSVPPSDFILADLCNRNLISCTVVPLVAEAGFPTEH